MLRKLRMEYEGAVYHVMSRGNDGVTRATRAAMTPGTKVPVQAIEHNPNMNLQNLSIVGDKFPGQ